MNKYKNNEVIYFFHEGKFHSGRIVGITILASTMTYFYNVISGGKSFEVKESDILC